FSNPKQKAVIWWLGAHAGISEHLQLGAFFLFEGRDRVGGGDDIGLNRFSEIIFEAKYSLVESFEPGFHPFAELQIVKWTYGDLPLQGHLTLGADRRFGNLLVAANASYWDSTTFRVTDTFRQPNTHRWPWVEGG